MKMSCPTIIQVTNISPQATKQQMVELFSYLGDIVELKLFPDDDESKAVPSKVCFVNFKDVDSVSTSLHLTNTIFIDRALVISRSRYDSIPGEEDAMSLAAPAVAIAANQTKSVGHTAPLLPTPPSMGAAVTPGLAGIAPGIPATVVPSSTSPSNPLISMMGTMVPPAPPLTGNVDPSKIEEIRRTVYVGNLNSSLTADQVLNFFLPCGEIKYVRMAGDETQPTRFVFVEFARPESVPIALQYNGAMFGDRPVKVNHSKNAIVKPQGPSAQETQREVDEAMRKVKEATAAITAVIEEPKDKKSGSRSKSRSRSRSRSRDRRRKRSRSYDRYRRRSRSRSPYYRRRGGGWRDSSRSPRRRYSRSRSPRRRSRTPPRRRSRTPPPRRRSRSPPPRRRSRTPPPRRRSRTPPSRRRSRSIGRHRSRSPVGGGRGRRRRSPSRSRSPSRERRKRDRKRSRSPTPPRSSRKRDRRERSRSRSKSPFGPAVPAADPAPSSSSRSKKKKHKHHRRKNHTPSPSPSPSPSPPPKPDSEEEEKSSPGSRSSDKSGMSVGSPAQDGGSGRGSLSPRGGGRGSGKGFEMQRGSSGSSSPVAANADSDSSYD